MKKYFNVGVLLVLHIVMVNEVLPYTVNGYSPSEYLGGSPEQLAIMEQNLGISGLVIEDYFYHRVPGLTVAGPVYARTNYWPNSWGEPDTESFLAYPTSTSFAKFEISPGADICNSPPYS